MRKAHGVHPITALQSEYSLLTKNVEGEILRKVRELGITLVPYSPLARGLFSNKPLDINELGDTEWVITPPTGVFSLSDISRVDFFCISSPSLV